MPFKSKAEERKYFKDYNKRSEPKKKKAEYMKGYMRSYRKDK